jgi:hypothetical protein
MRRSAELLCTCAIFCCALCALSYTRAEFVLDDFNDSAQVVSPAMEGQLIGTDHVGDLDAHRDIYIYGSLSDPNATLDANLTTPSMFTGTFSSFAPSDPLGGLMRFATDYKFGDFHDLTEGGRNNALLLDFVSVGGPTPPTLLFVIHDNSDEMFVDIPSASGPMTLALPFDMFRGRGGGPRISDFTEVKQIFFDFFITNSAADPPGGFFELDRIHVGQAPEPSTLYLSRFGLGAILIRFGFHRVGCAKLIPLRDK